MAFVPFGDPNVDWAGVLRTKCEEGKVEKGKEECTQATNGASLTFKDEKDLREKRGNVSYKEQRQPLLSIISSE